MVTGDTPRVIVWAGQWSSDSPHVVVWAGHW